MSRPNEVYERKTLGLAVEAYVRPSSLPRRGDMRMLQNLFRILDLRLDQTFLTSLSTKEMQTTALIEEWWTRQHDDILDQAKIGLFTYVISGESDRSRATEIQKLQQLVPTADQPTLYFVISELADPAHPAYKNETREDFDIRYAATDLSQYHYNMIRCCMDELSCRPLYGNVFDDNIFRLAALARMSYACLSSLRTEPNDGSQHPTAPVTLDCLRNGTWRPDIPTFPNPCPWLENAAQDETSTDPAGNLPRYLWDIEAQRTVTVATLRQSSIEYAIVSHTWGRWRKSGNGTKVEGVDLWHVPENTRFDVTQLPKMLKSAGFAEQYVWFDLLCIPQDCSDNRLAEECKLEVARQATIFRNAKTAVAWLNDIEFWGQLQATLPWFGIRWLMKTTTDPHWFKGIEVSLEVAKMLASDSCGLLVGRSGNMEERLPGWMSSLWTLQESIMRPDMVLVSSAWRPLTINYALPITIGDLVALVYADSETFEENSNYYKPPGAKELTSCLTRTAMNYITSGNQMKSLIMGRSRVCTNSRAEAIMSVAGATDWYVGKTVDQFREIRDHYNTDLVCGLYPLEFVRELQNKIGPGFFMCFHEIATVDWVQNENDGSMERVELKGSMLPFTPSHLNDGKLFRTFAHDSGYPAHSSVSTWVIQGDGSVVLPEVGILATNTPYESNRHAHMLASTYIIGNDPKGINRGSSDAMDVDLLSHIRKFDGEAIAICTMESRWGIIIHRPERGHGTFVKAGVFWVPDYDRRDGIEIPESTEVNWLVI